MDRTVVRVAPGGGGPTGYVATGCPLIVSWSWISICSIRKQVQQWAYGCEGLRSRSQDGWHEDEELLWLHNESVVVPKDRGDRQEDKIATLEKSEVAVMILQHQQAQHLPVYISLPLNFRGGVTSYLSKAV